MKSFTNDCDLLQMWEQRATVGASNREMAKEAPQPFHTFRAKSTTSNTVAIRLMGMGSKCLLGQHSITHLGFHYSAEGVIPSGDKTKAIVERSVPKSSDPSSGLQLLLALQTSLCR